MKGKDTDSSSHMSRLMLALFKPETPFGYNANSADLIQNADSDKNQHNLLTGITMQKYNENDTPKTRNGLIQMIKMDKSTGLKRVHIYSMNKTEGHLSKQYLYYYVICGSSSEILHIQAHSA